MIVCNRCKKNPAQLGKKACRPCLDKEGASQKARLDERRAKGLCVRCGDPVDAPQFSRCPTCREYNRIRKCKAYKKRRDQGLCTQCGKPVASGKSKCAKCLAAGTVRERAYRYKRPDAYAKERDGFKCRLCGEPSQNLDAHHIDGNGRQVKRKHNRSPNNDLDNLISLCRGCHLLVSYAIRKHSLDLSLFLDLAQRGRAGP